MNEADPLAPPDYQALAELRYQIRRFLHISEEAARAAGIEPQQHQLLLAIKGLPDGFSATIGEVAERLQIQHHSAVGLVDRLEARGLVRRRRDQADGRQVVLDLTPSAETLLADLSRVHRRELRTIAPALVEALRSITAEVHV